MTKIQNEHQDKQAKMVIDHQDRMAELHAGWRTEMAKLRESAMSDIRNILSTHALKDKEAEKVDKGALQ